MTSQPLNGTPHQPPQPQLQVPAECTPHQIPVAWSVQYNPATTEVSRTADQWDELLCNVTFEEA